MERLVGLPCTIRPGAFSGERIFEMTVPTGGSYRSMAPRHRFFKSDDTPLGPEEPEGDAMEGFVIGRQIGRTSIGKSVTVVLPDGTPVEYPSERIKAVPEDAAEYVPI